jgi:hypothetical protein
MNEYMQDAERTALEERSRQLFQGSVAGLDMRVRSRLTQARHAALEAAAASSPRPWFFRKWVWTPAAGVTAAALLGAALWFGLPAGHQPGMTSADNQPSIEDLDIVASSDEDDGVRAGDAIEMLQNDLDFYDFADKAANSGPAA